MPVSAASRPLNSTRSAQPKWPQEEEAQSRRTRSAEADSALLRQRCRMLAPAG